jgi:hypothetical protein
LAEQLIQLAATHAASAPDVLFLPEHAARVDMEALQYRMMATTLFPNLDAASLELLAGVCRCATKVLVGPYNDSLPAAERQRMVAEAKNTLGQGLQLFNEMNVGALLSPVQHCIVNRWFGVFDGPPFPSLQS